MTHDHILISEWSITLLRVLDSSELFREARSSDRQFEIKLHLDFHFDSRWRLFCCCSSAAPHLPVSYRLLKRLVAWNTLWSYCVDWCRFKAEGLKKTTILVTVHTRAALMDAFIKNNWDKPIFMSARNRQLQGQGAAQVLSLCLSGTNINR